MIQAPVPHVSNKQRPTLLYTLRRLHQSTALAAMITFTLSVSLASLAAFRSYAEHNQALIARTMAYTLEAAAVFQDTAVAEEELQSISKQESLAYSSLRLLSGETLAEYRQPKPSAQAQFEQQVAKWLLPHESQARIEHEGHWVGTVTARSNGDGLISLVYATLLGLAASLVVFALAVAWLSRRVRLSILAPLNTLAEVTHAARGPHPGKRAPPAELAELHSLAEDVNALLDQVDAYHAKLVSENKSLSQMALHDALTGLPNRSHFFKHLNEALTRAKEDGTSLAVIYMDCDHFKEVNDTYGHAIGDALLIDLAQRIRVSLRESDILTRLGGDEFVAVLMHAGSAKNAKSIANKLCNNLAEPLKLPDGSFLKYSVSMGIAVFPPPTADQQGNQILQVVDASLLVEQADNAMYQAKTKQRGTICVYNHAIDSGNSPREQETSR